MFGPFTYIQNVMPIIHRVILYPVIPSINVSFECLAQGLQARLKQLKKSDSKEGVCKTTTGYLRMADADGKMSIEKIVNNNKNKKKPQIWIYKLCR